MKSKEEILNELKEELKEKNVQETKTEENKEEVKVNIPFPKKKKKKKKFKKNIEEKETSFKEQVQEEINEIKKEREENELLTPEFLSFKESFLKDEVKRDFLTNLLPGYRSKGYTDIDNDKYLLLKLKNPSLKAFVIEGSFDEIQVGILGHIYFIKPIYQEEYRKFKTEFGNEEEFPNEFLTFVLKNCIIYPEIKEEEIKIMPAGRSLSIFHTIKVMSDLTKKFHVIEA